MKINRIADVHPPTPDTEVAVKICGNIAEVRYMRRTPDGCPIQKLSDKLYLDIRTGEVKEIQSSESRSDDLASVAQSLKRLRDLINANLTDPETALWVTLTYAENMRDAEKLYEDYRRFWQRFKYYAAKEGCYLAMTGKSRRFLPFAGMIVLDFPGPLRYCVLPRRDKDG